MVQHPTLVPKLHRRFPGGLSCDFDGVVSGLGVKFVRTYQFAGALSEQAQLIVSSFLRRGPAIVLSERGTGLSRRMPFRPRSSYAYRPAFRIDLPVHHELRCSLISGHRASACATGPAIQSDGTRPIPSDGEDFSPQPLPGISPLPLRSRPQPGPQLTRPSAGSTHKAERCWCLPHRKDAGRPSEGHSCPTQSRSFRSGSCRCRLPA